MAYDSLKNIIRQYIKTNGEQEITGQIMQNVLIEMVNNYPSTDGYATQSWVNQQGYVTSSALAGYLPVTGGTINGNLHINDRLSISAQSGSPEDPESYDFYLENGVINIDDRTVIERFRIKADSIIKNGGTSSQFLKADGSVDSSAYITSAALAGYLPLTGGTMVGTLYIQPPTERATLYLNSQLNVPTDIYMGSQNSSRWSISARELGDNRLIFYSSGLTSYPFELEWGTGIGLFRYGLKIGYKHPNLDPNRATLYLISDSNNPCDLILGSNSDYKWSINCRNSSQDYSFGIYRNNNIQAFWINGSTLNVGIGTIAPAYKLDVNGSANATTLYENGTSLSSKYLALTGGTLTGNLTINSGRDLTYLTIYGQSSNGYGRMYVDGDGFNFQCSRGLLYFQNESYFSHNVDVDARMGVGTDHSNTYQLIVNGQVGATGFVNTSDLRKKNIMGDVPMNLYNVANAPLFKFTWNDEKEYSGQHIGSAAQYWQTVLPELVIIGSDTEQTLAMQYDVIALASVITVAKTVVSHERRIIILERENEELRKELAALKSA